MRNINEEIVKIKRLMLIESEEKEGTDSDTGEKNFMSYGDTTIKVSGGWLKDNNGRIGCVKVKKPFYLGGGAFAQGIKKLTQKVKGNVVAEPKNAISLYDEINLTKSDKDSLIKKWNNNEIFSKTESGAEILIGRTKSMTEFCKKDWES